MNAIIQNILWAVAGIVTGIVIVKLIKQKRTVEDNNDSQTKPEIIENPKKQEYSLAKAKDSFIENLDRFIPYLDNYRSKPGFEKWTEQIVDINNDDLTHYWEIYCNDLGTWDRIMLSWGLKKDTCKSFTYMEKYSTAYALLNNERPVEGKKYRVVSGCWILTENQQKRIIKKGIIEEI